MTTEEKNLLLKDLSARFPYKVKCELLHYDYKHAAKIIGLNNFVVKIIIPGTSIIKETPITNVKPFLFPLSSMTDTQKEIYNTLERDVLFGTKHFIETYDWLNSHHFDYRNLIEKGLAIDATGLNIYWHDNRYKRLS